VYNKETPSAQLFSPSPSTELHPMSNLTQMFGILMMDVLVETCGPCSAMLPSSGMDYPQLACSLSTTQPANSGSKQVSSSMINSHPSQPQPQTIAVIRIPSASGTCTSKQKLKCLTTSYKTSS